MDGKMETLTTMFVPLDFLNAVVYSSIKDPIVELWDSIIYELAEKAKDKGIAGINDFMLTSAGNDQRYRYSIIEISQLTLDKLLQGSFKNLTDLKIFQSENKSYFPLYNIFCYEKVDENGGENKVIIDSIFIN